MKAFKLLGCLLVLIISGCISNSQPQTSTVENTRREIETLTVSYYLAPIQDRRRFIAPTVNLEDHWSQYYNDRTPLARATSVTVDDVRTLTNGVRRVYASVVRDSKKRSQECYVKNVRGKWLVDWEATVGFNPISLRTFKANVSQSEPTVRVWIQISDYYNFEYRNKEKSHFSFELTDVNGETLNGFILKDSTAGKRLLEITKDGEAHEVAVTIKRTGRDGSVAEITSLASLSWVID